MSGFGKKKYTKPVICGQINDLSKDWYVFFQFKQEGRTHSYKRREGINRIKKLRQRIKAIKELCIDIEFDLEHGWNPTVDPKRQELYFKFSSPKNKRMQRRMTKEDWRNYFLNKNAP